MDLIIDSKSRKTFSDQQNYDENHERVTTVDVLDMGSYVYHRLRGPFASIPEIWKATSVSIFENASGRNTEIKASFLYYPKDTESEEVSKFRTEISVPLEGQLERLEKRIIFYNKSGAIEEDIIISEPLGKTLFSKVDRYVLNTESGQYVNDDGQFYPFRIIGDSILDTVNALAEEAEKKVVENGLKR